MNLLPIVSGSGDAQWHADSAAYNERLFRAQDLERSIHASENENRRSPLCDFFHGWEPKQYIDTAPRRALLEREIQWLRTERARLAAVPGAGVRPAA